MRGFIKISDFNLMIFDECHNAQKNAPMASLMTEFSEYPDKEHPRVIGLTGMLTAPSVKPVNVLDDLNNLEARFRATIKTAHGDLASDVCVYSTCPNEEFIQYDESPDTEFQNSIFNILGSLKQTINEWPLSDREDESQMIVGNRFDSVFVDFMDHLSNLGMLKTTAEKSS